MSDTRWFHAPCPLGLEPILAAELEELGAKTIKPRKAGVDFQGDRPVGYAVALWSRVATRVFEEIQRGRINDANDVYLVAKRVRWSKWLLPGQTFAVHGTARSPLIPHPHYVALKVKDAIADQLREEWGQRPDVDTDNPHLPLRIHVDHKVATISRDLVGGSLHRRGYRPVQHKSPLNEALAAGLLQLTSWDKRSPLCDPMCGSATFLIEAAWLAGDRAPGLGRKFAFQRWPDLNESAWNALLADAEARWKRGKSSIPPLFGNDRHEGSLAIAKQALGRAEVDGYVRLDPHDIQSYTPPTPPAAVVTNPPYGERLQPEDLQNTWFQLGRFLKTHCPGASAWVLAGNPEMTRHLHMRSAQKTPVFNGKIECRWLQYDIRPRATEAAPSPE